MGYEPGPDDEDYGPDLDWLNEPIEIEPALWQKFSGDRYGPTRERRFTVLYPLAERLGFDRNHLSDVLLDMLDSLIPALGRVLTAYRNQWASLIEADEHHKVARAVVRRIDSTELDRAGIDLHCSRDHVDCRYSDVDEARRQILTDELARRLSKFFAAEPKKRQVRTG